eukprot:1459634-Pyramimonas_sp.AAC.1
MALASSAPRPVVFRVHNSLKDSQLASQVWCFGTMSDCQGATVTLVRDVEVPGMVLWHSSGVASGCFPTGCFPQ